MAILFYAGTASHTVATPSEYRQGYIVAGTVLKMSTGRPVTRASATLGRLEFVLSWSAVLSIWKPALEGAFGLLCSGATSFVDPNGETYTVIRHPEQDKILFTGVYYNLNYDRWRFRTELRMVEST